MNTVVFGKNQVLPSKIVCVGKNYVDHIHELGDEVPENMVVFSKPNSSITNTLQAVHEETVHFEAEICFLIKDGCYTGVGCGLDLTKRALQSVLKKNGLPWERAKAFNGAALFSPFVPIDDETHFEVQLLINGEERQKGDVTQMIYPPETILREITKFMSLENGDVIMTGTPAGVGAVAVGDIFECKLFSKDKLLTEAKWRAE